MFLDFRSLFFTMFLGVCCASYTYGQLQPDVTAAGDEVIITMDSEDDDYLLSTNVLENPVTAVDTQKENRVELIDFSCVEMALPEVIRLFTRASGANIVATTTDEMKQAKVTVELKQVAWKPALNSILNMHNYELVQETPGVEIYSVEVKKPDALPPLLVKTIFFKYTTTDEVLPIVKSLLISDSRAKLSSFESRNAVVIKSTDSNIREIEDIIKAIDIPSNQVAVETKFLELSDSAAKQLGIKWDSLEEFGVGLTAGPFEYTKSQTIDNTDGSESTLWDINRRADTITDTADYYGNYNGEDSAFNGPLPGYEGTYNPDDISGQTDPVGSSYSLTDSIDTGQDIISDSLSQFAENITKSQAAILDVDSLNLVLSALKRTDGVSMISNPKILVASGNRDAKFSVGEHEPIIKTTLTEGTTDSPGDKITAELDTSINTDYINQGYMRTGIELLVVPFVKTEKYIQAEIAPSLIRKTGEKVIEENSWPIISVKQIKTLFTLKSGQTVAIGGLTTSTEEDSTTKVPFLGDIPIIGKYLFSHQSTSTEQTETIIFVTLSIAEPDNMSEDSGIPENSKLVYKRVLKEKLKQKQFERDFQEIKEATNKEIDAIDEAMYAKTTNQVDSADVGVDIETVDEIDSNEVSLEQSTDQ